MYIYKKCIFLYLFAFVMPSFINSMHQSHTLALIEKELLLHAIAAKDQNVVDVNENVGLNIEFTLYKTDMPNRLTSSIFNSIEIIELESDNDETIKPFGVFKNLNCEHIRYAWLGGRGERLPAILIKAHLSKEKIKKMKDELLKS